jgi:hypothetical protein
MFTPIKDRVARDKLVQDYLETKDRVKQKFVNEQLGQLDYQEDAKKIFKPIIDSQDTAGQSAQQALKNIKETIVATIS